MEIEELDIKGAWLIRGVRHTDERGWFQEWFKKSSLAEAAGFDFQPFQANISKSIAGTIRGIHYSTAPEGQAKFVTVMNGEIDDYVIDISPSSPTFGQWTRVRLNSDTGDAMLLSKHMGHAFQALCDNTVVSYLVSAEYNPSAEKGITPFCETIGIDWSLNLAVSVSDKDASAPSLLTQRQARLLP